jgi:hypothetical protein
MGVTHNSHGNWVPAVLSAPVILVVFVAEARGWLDHPFRRSLRLIAQSIRRGSVWLRLLLAVTSPALLLLLWSVAASATFIKWVFWVFDLIWWGRWRDRRPDRSSSDGLSTTATE